MKGLVRRTAWGARAAGCSTPLERGRVRGLAIHYTAAASDQTGDPAARVRAVQAFHMSPAAGGGEGPWCDVAYNFLVSSDGRIFEGRGWHNRSAAQGTNEGNDRYIAVCFLGADRPGRDDVTPAGRAAIAELVREFRRVYGREPDVRPHSSFHATACPGDELRAFIAARGWRVAQPRRTPAWWWRWAAWRLGDVPGPRPSSAPRLIPPWAWAQLAAFVRRRRHAERR